MIKAPCPASAGRDGFADATGESTSFIDLAITSLAELEAAAKDGRIAKAKGLGALIAEPRFCKISRLQKMAKDVFTFIVWLPCSNKPSEHWKERNRIFDTSQSPVISDAAASSYPIWPWSRRLLI